jgi:hypothetical protein
MHGTAKRTGPARAAPAAAGRNGSEGKAAA